MMVQTSSKLSGNAREDILSSIRRNLTISKPFDAIHREHSGVAVVTDLSPRVEALSSEALIDTFRENLEAVGGNLTVVADEFEAAKSVKHVIGKLSAKCIAISDSELVKSVVRRISDTTVISGASAEVLFDCDLGITAAQWAIAETGTLVLESEKESHRLTSLVPAAHLCIVRSSDIRYGLGEILSLVSRNLSRTITFITGASRTSDIELTLAIGVHGPGELHVIVIDDQ